MHIAFDAKRLFNNHTGLGNYSRTLVDNLVEYSPNIDVSLFAPNIQSSAYRQKYSNFDIHTYNGPLSAWWRSFGMVSTINKLAPNIYHGLSNELPLNSNKIKARKVVTIHDLFYEKYPEDFSKIDRQIYKFKTKKACELADVIIAISEATKRDIIDFINVDEQKIEVVYQSCNRVFQDNVTIDDFSFQELPDQYFLYVGTVNKRKNLVSIIKAMSLIKKENLLPLVVVGNGPTDYLNELKLLISKYRLEKYVFFMGQIDNHKLKVLYKNARFTSLPSHYEGFGIPIIESLFTGTPVLTSTNSSLPEAAGECGLLINPNSIEDIKEALSMLINHDEVLEKLKTKIPDHIKTFSNMSVNQKLIDVYELIC